MNTLIGESIEPGIKVGMSHVFYSSVTDKDLFFLKQLGISHIQGWVTANNSTYDDIMEFRRKIEEAGFTLFHLGHWDLFSTADIILGFPGRDAKIERFKEFLRNLGKAGIHTTTIAWAAPVHTEDFRTTTTIRGCTTRSFDMNVVEKIPLQYGRTFTDDELWENYVYFIERILPVAEETGVRLALHPSDPPVPMGGVPGIFRSSSAYERARKSANHSPHAGILFCLGTWGEMAGTDGNGEDIIGAIQHFGRAGALFEMHFRNVNSPVPRFHETFVDSGYIDMYGVVKALEEVGFNGLLVPDHLPQFENRHSSAGHGVDVAYSIGYMKGIVEAVAKET